MYINVLEMLEENVRDNPDRIALSDADTRISYIELYNNARKIASHIGKAINYQTNKPVAVCIDRNITSIELFMGVLYSGNFYVPIDVNMPAERIGIIFEDLKPELILSSNNQEIDDYKITDISVILEESTIDDKQLAKIRTCHIDTNPMYAIFTSGSTGRPKGVLVSHRSVIDLVEQFNVAFSFSEEPVFGNQAPFDFDVSVKDIYNALYQHGTVCVIPKQCFSMPLKLIEYINDRNIDTIIWAVSAMRIVENFKTFSHLVPKSLRLVMFSGEIMPVKVLNYWKQYVDATFVNLYGPTEITCNCSYYIVDREYSVDEALPIGIPFRNTQILLIDTENGDIIDEANRQGEICVRGTCLALGYYNAKKLTEESFAPSPLSDAYPERIYKTGDLGFYDENGLLQFTSRKDYQIKHMGHRIEMGEIEVAVNAIEYIDAAVCVFDTKKEKIVLFYQPNNMGERFGSSRELEKDIVKCLSKKLQKYMWPNIYIAYEKLPLNKNGKIDRVYLAKTLVD